jgi:predicted dehydrogenase
MTKDDRLLRIGVLGAGPIAQAAHFDGCRRARNAELYAICDVAADLLTRTAEIYAPGVTYADYDAMLADPLVEAVVVAVADQFHVPLALRALTAGKHVLVEKPLGVAVEECEELRRTVCAAGLVLQVGNNKRFDPGLAFAARFIHEEIGQLAVLNTWYCDSVYRYTMTDNLQPLMVTSAQARRPAGDAKADRARYFLLAHGSHLVDTARFLGGAFVGLRARLLHAFEAYHWAVEVDFANGCLGHLNLIIPARGDFQEGVQVYGERGSVAGRTYLPWYKKASDVECFSTRDGQYHRLLGADGDTYKLQIEGFAETILHGAPQQGAGVDDGVAQVRALVAIARSAASGEYVRLADVEGAV